MNEPGKQDRRQAAIREIAQALQKHECVMVLCRKTENQQEYLSIKLECAEDIDTEPATLH